MPSCTYDGTWTYESAGTYDAPCDCTYDGDWVYDSGGTFDQPCGVTPPPSSPGPDLEPPYYRRTPAVRTVTRRPERHQEDDEELLALLGHSVPHH